jgi:uncharacterized membrane protein
MEELFKGFASNVALAIELLAAIIIGIGAIEAVYRLVRRPFGGPMGLEDKKEVWLHFAAWLVLGLEFELAADVLRTAISPSWDDIGQLGAIAVIRTLLNTS